VANQARAFGLEPGCPSAFSFQVSLPGDWPGQTPGWQQPATASFLFPLVSLGNLFNRLGH
jgi:hypothetical protein